MGTQRDEQRETDDKTLAAVRAGKCRLAAIAMHVSVVMKSDHAETRKIDRSLQRLRKARRLKYDVVAGWTEVAR